MQQSYDLSDPTTCETYFVALLSTISGSSGSASGSTSNNSNTTNAISMNMEHQAHIIHLLQLGASSFHKASQAVDQMMAAPNLSSSSTAATNNTTTNNTAQDVCLLTAEQGKQYLEAAATHLPHVVLEHLLFLANMNSGSTATTSAGNNTVNVTPSTTSSSTQQKRFIQYCNHLYQIHPKNNKSSTNAAIDTASLLMDTSNANKGGETNTVLHNEMTNTMKSIFQAIGSAAHLCSAYNKKHYISQSGIIPSFVKLIQCYQAAQGGGSTPTTSVDQQQHQPQQQLQPQPQSGENLYGIVIPIYADFLQVCCLASHYHYAWRFLQSNNPLSSSTTTTSATTTAIAKPALSSFHTESFLRYFYNLGRLHLGNNDYTLALDAFMICMKVPCRSSSNGRSNSSGGGHVIGDDDDDMDMSPFGGFRGIDLGGDGRGSSGGGGGASAMSAIAIAAWKKILLVKCLSLSMNGLEEEEGGFSIGGGAFGGGGSATRVGVEEVTNTPIPGSRVKKSMTSSNKKSKNVDPICAKVGASNVTSKHILEFPNGVSPSVQKFLKKAADITISFHQDSSSSSSSSKSSGTGNNEVSDKDVEMVAVDENQTSLLLKYSGLIAYNTLVNMFTDNDATYTNFVNLILPPAQSSSTSSSGATTDADATVTNAHLIHQLLVQDGNLGLAKQLLTVYYLQTVRRIAQVYEALPLAKLYDKLDEAGCIPTTTDSPSKEKNDKVIMVQNLLTNITNLSESSTMLTYVPMEMTMDMEQSVIYFHNEGSSTGYENNNQGGNHAREEQEQFQTELMDRITNCMKLAKRVSDLDTSTKLSTKYQANFMKDDLIKKNNTSTGGGQSGDGGGGGGLSVMEEDILTLQF